MNMYKFHELSVGLKVDFSATVSIKTLRQFRDLSGDENPLHLDDEYARTRGVDGKVVYGLMIGAFYSRLFGMYLPGRNGMLHSIDIRFVKPVYVDDKLFISGEVVYLHDALKVVEISATVLKDNKTEVSRARLRGGLFE